MNDRHAITAIYRSVVKVRKRMLHQGEREPARSLDTRQGKSLLSSPQHQGKSTHTSSPHSVPPNTSASVGVSWKKMSLPSHAKEYNDDFLANRQSNVELSDVMIILVIINLAE